MAQEDEDDDEEEDHDEENEEPEEEDWDWSELEKTSVGSAMSLVVITALLVVGVLCWKKYGRKRTMEEHDTYVEYKEEINEMESEDLNKLKDELDVIVNVIGEGMEQMIHSLETMCETAEQLEAVADMKTGDKIC